MKVLLCAAELALLAIQASYLTQTTNVQQMAFSGVCVLALSGRLAYRIVTRS